MRGRRRSGWFGADDALLNQNVCLVEREPQVLVGIGAQDGRAGVHPLILRAEQVLDGVLLGRLVADGVEGIGTADGLEKIFQRDRT